METARSKPFFYLQVTLGFQTKPTHTTSEHLTHLDSMLAILQILENLEKSDRV